MTTMRKTAPPPRLCNFVCVIFVFAFVYGDDFDVDGGAKTKRARGDDGPPSLSSGGATTLHRGGRPLDVADLRRDDDGAPVPPADGPRRRPLRRRRGLPLFSVSRRRKSLLVVATIAVVDVDRGNTAVATIITAPPLLRHRPPGAFVRSGTAAADDDVF